MIFRLEPPIPILTPKGDALALAWIDRGDDYDLQWVSFVEDTRECWTFDNCDVRQIHNYTMGRPKIDPSVLFGPKVEVAATTDAPMIDLDSPELLEELTNWAQAWWTRFGNPTSHVEDDWGVARAREILAVIDGVFGGGLRS